MAAMAAVKAMEVACVFSPEDWQAAGETSPLGFKCSGSFCGRNIEKIYQEAKSSGRPCDLGAAVQALRKATHVLVISGFFVLWPQGPPPFHGSCETDGPLGALAVLRALCARGIKVSLFCDVHNGPVMKKAYDSMLAHFKEHDPGFWEVLCSKSRCLPFVADDEAADGGQLELLRREVFGEEATTELQDRCLRTCRGLARVLDEPVDALFALERLGAPYRNIRGTDVGHVTEPIDCLFPLIEAPHAKPFELPLHALRRLARVAEDVITVAVGDGGNEVGMGKVANLPGCRELAPEGPEGFASLAVNGCVRSCDFLVLGTVSNWAGSAFEAACHVLWVPESPYVAGGPLSALEEKLLRAVMAPPELSVDGKCPEKELSVDGMSFEPHHREFYEYLWQLAEEPKEPDSKMPRTS